MSSDLASNPFAILGVSPRDRSERARAAVDAASGALAASRREAAARLGASASRLDAEMAWLPGAPPEIGAQAIAGLGNASALAAIPVQGLARANILIDAIAALPDSDAERLAEWTELLASAAAFDSVDDLLAQINADRALAGVMLVSSRSAVEEALARRRATLIERACAEMTGGPTRVMLKAMRALAERVPAPSDPMLVALFDRYAAGVGDWLAEEAEAAVLLANEIARVARLRPDALTPLTDSFEQLLGRWAEIALPVQRAAGARRAPGDPASIRLAEALTHAIDALQRNAIHAAAAALTNQGMAALAGVPQALSTLRDERSEIDRDMAELAKRDPMLHYSVALGSILSRELRISPDGVYYRDVFTSVYDIEAIRWGRYAYGDSLTPWGVSWTVRGRKTNVNLAGRAICEEIIATMRRAWGPMLMKKVATRLHRGEPIRLGKAVLRDGSIALPIAWSFGETVELGWEEIEMAWDNDRLRLSGRAQANARVRLDPSAFDNIAIIEDLIARAQARRWTRLSDGLI
ncbi:hypothetical protein TPR58_18250 [Sphingomonas sp. HF-S3]|uniref:Uncharacterized protein n=1 Tax=Sphingomonas rustica TaxID=3103142 RepID=A0ABV0BEA3_9SPHN